MTKLKRPIINDIVGLLAYTLPILGIVCIILYSSTGFINKNSWQTVVYALTTFIFVGGASYLSGGLIGFLFGIPKQKVIDDNTGVGIQKIEYIPNTNLEQISDWFTKIVVGVGLINMKEIAGWISEIAALAGKDMGLRGNPTTFITALIVYFVCCGFLNGYLATRIILPEVFNK